MEKRKTKNEMMADLYALRAGLSTISLQTDEIRKGEEIEEEKSEKLEELKEAYEETKDVCKKAEKALKEIRKTRIEAEELLSEKRRRKEIDNADIKALKKRLKEEWKQRLKDMKKDLKDIDRSKFWDWEFEYGGKKLFHLLIPFYQFYYLALMGGYACVCGMDSLMKKQELKAERKKPYKLKNYQKEQRKEIETLEYAQRKTKKLEEESNKTYFSAMQNVEWAKNEYERLKEKTNNELAVIKNNRQQIVTQSQTMKNALNGACDSWIAESDWENIDLLIYYLETKRTDTLKEALFLLDRQKQTDEIVDTIESVGRRLVSTIETANSRLGQALSQSFSLISSQLSGISAKMDSVQGIRRELEKGLQQQNEALNLNNALLEKANKSSEDLLYDLRYNQRFWVK